MLIDKIAGQPLFIIGNFKLSFCIFWPYLADIYNESGSMNLLPIIKFITCDKFSKFILNVMNKYLECRQLKRK